MEYTREQIELMAVRAIHPEGGPRKHGSSRDLANTIIAELVKQGVLQFTVKTVPSS